MKSSLNDLVRAALGDANAQEAGLIEKTAAAKAATLPIASATTGYVEHEKLAAALEFIGRRGVENLVKTASTAVEVTVVPVEKAVALDKTASVKHDPEQVRAALAKKLAEAAAGGQ